jgi:hypothetical protein
MRPRIPLALLRREVLRACAAYVLYLVLQPVWSRFGLRALYESLVLAVAGRLFLPIQHFDVLATLDNLSIVNIDFLVVLVISLFLVAWRMPWADRTKRFGAALSVIFVLHVAAVILEIRVRSAQELWAQQQLLILLPWEFRVVERLKYLLYDVGLQLGPFLMLGLTATWNGLADLAVLREPERLRRRREDARTANVFWRRRFLALACGIAVLAAAAAVWRWQRESNPLHIAAHARLGHIYWEHRSLHAAEQQYRIALDGNTSDPDVYYKLAGLVSQRADRRQAADLLRRGLGVAADPAWQRRFREALAAAGQASR